MESTSLDMNHIFYIYSARKSLECVRKVQISEEFDAIVPYDIFLEAFITAATVISKRILTR